EMRRVSRLAAKLATMPRLESDPDGPERAGAPFEMPYTLDLPSSESDRWRRHLDVLETSLNLVRRMYADPADAEDPLLQELAASDMETRQILQAAAADDILPPQPDGFKKVVRILDDSVRGFHIGVH